MSQSTSDVLPRPQPNDITPEEFTRLQDALKRCSPATFEAVCEFRRTGKLDHLRTVIVGVIERYVERDQRPKLKNADANLRLVEDLGIDSLTMMEIVLLAEDILNITVSNEELIKLRTLGDVQQFISAKTVASSA